MSYNKNNYSQALDALERGNEAELDALQDKVDSLKRISQRLNADLDEDSQVLDGLDNKVDSAQSQLSRTLDSLSAAVDGTNRMSPFRIVGGLVLAMLLLYLFLKFTRF